MKKLFYVLICSLVTLFFTQSVYGASSEMEILLKKLQEKGVLTASEAESISKETKEAAAAVEKAAEKKEQTAKASELPDWIKNTKFKGDLRLRYEPRDREDDARGTAGRARFRLRAGVEAAVNKDVTVGFGLATGSGDQRSANQTMTGTFTRKDIWVDYAYARYTPVKWFSIMGGKFVNPIWQPGDMLISTDVNPEGAAFKMEGQVAPNFSLFLNGAVFVLDDRNGATTSSADPLMYVFQPGFKWNFTKDAFFRFAPAYYGFSDLKNANVLTGGTGFSAGNTNTQTAGKYKYNYSAISWGGEIGFNKPFGISMIPYFGIMGGYIQNPDPSKNKTGYLAGFSIGYPDVKKTCDWSFEYTFRRIEKDAWLDFLPDSSFYSGKTNVMGHRAKLAFGLTKNVSFGINYYNTWMVRGGPATENLVQGDLIFKF